MGEERDELMFAMYLAARDNALESRGARDGGGREPPHRASRRGCLGGGPRHLPLSEYDQDLLKAFVARVLLIDAFGKGTLGEE